MVVLVTPGTISRSAQFPTDTISIRKWSHSFLVTFRGRCSVDGDDIAYDPNGLLRSRALSPAIPELALREVFPEAQSDRRDGSQKADPARCSVSDVAESQDAGLGIWPTVSKMQPKQTTVTGKP